MKTILGIALIFILIVVSCELDYEVCNTVECVEDYCGEFTSNCDEICDVCVFYGNSCTYPGCSNLRESFSRYCDEH